MGIITEQSVKNLWRKWVLGCPLVGEEKEQRQRREDLPLGSRGFTQDVMGHKES